MTDKEYIKHIRYYQFWLADLITERDKIWTQIDIKCQTDEERKEMFDKFRFSSTVQNTINEIAWVLRDYNQSYIEDTYEADPTRRLSEVSVDNFRLPRHTNYDASKTLVNDIVSESWTDLEKSITELINDPDNLIIKRLDQHKFIFAGDPQFIESEDIVTDWVFILNPHERLRFGTIKSSFMQTEQVTFLIYEFNWLVNQKSEFLKVDVTNEHEKLFDILYAWLKTMPYNNIAEYQKYVSDLQKEKDGNK